MLLRNIGHKLDMGNYLTDLTVAIPIVSFSYTMLYPLGYIYWESPLIIIVVITIAIVILLLLLLLLVLLLLLLLL